MFVARPRGDIFMSRCPRCGNPKMEILDCGWRKSACYWNCPEHKDCVKEGVRCDLYWCPLSDFRHLCTPSDSNGVAIGHEMRLVDTHLGQNWTNNMIPWTDVQLQAHKEKYWKRPKTAETCEGFHRRRPTWRWRWRWHWRWKCRQPTCE